eukprot:1860902-Pyramimonas_sp.AAC.1
MHSTDTRLKWNPSVQQACASLSSAPTGKLRVRTCSNGISLLSFEGSNSLERTLLVDHKVG